MGGRFFLFLNVFINNTFKDILLGLIIMEDFIDSYKFEIILKYADLLCPNKYNSKYDNHYYLKNIIYVLNDFVSWKSLKYSKFIESTSIYHYKSIHKKHILWSNSRVYYYAYNEIINNNNLCNITENLYIDNTLIINKYGSEDIGFGNGICRKKKYTSLTAVINENKKPVLVFKNSSYSKRNNTIHTLPHETNSLLISIDALEHKIDKPTYFVGDKGFIINKNKINNKYVSIVTPKKTNQKIKNTDDENKRLNNRSSIEIFFGKLKNHNRILVRRDKLINTYLGFVYLGCIYIL